MERKMISLKYSPKNSISWLLANCTLVSLIGGASAQEWTPQPEQVLGKKSDYSPYTNQHFPQQVFFGDTHHHSSYSFDSGMFGNTLGPAESLDRKSVV